MDPILIIGGGIGGLTVANALMRQNIPFHVYEQTDAFRPVGAGILLSMNAMAVMETLGLGQEIEAAGNPLSLIGIRTDQGEVLSIVDAGKIGRALKRKSVAISRPVLHQILVSKLPADAITLGAKFQTLNDTPQGVTASFENGLEAAGPILIGADGIRSRVRKAIKLDSPLREANQICYRGIVELNLGSAGPPEEFYESWGIGKRFGFVHISPSTVYWYATLNKSRFGDPAQDEAVDLLNREFSDWAPPLPEIIAAIREDSLVRHDLGDKKSSQVWHRGNVVLMGDAIHATTPNMGQGAGMAIESAAALAFAIGSTPDRNTAFEIYTRERYPRTRMVTDRSRQIGNMGNWVNPVSIAVRNTVMRWTPQWLGEQQAEAIFSYTPKPS